MTYARSSRGRRVWRVKRPSKTGCGRSLREPKMEASQADGRLRSPSRWAKTFDPEQNVHIMLRKLPRLAAQASKLASFQELTGYFQWITPARDDYQFLRSTHLRNANR